MLICQNLTKSYTSIEGTKQVLDHLNLKIEEGSFTILLGGNGAGKSTLLKLISGDESADSGDILMDNVSIASLSSHKRAKHLAKLSQTPSLGTVGSMTVLENLSLYASKGSPYTLKPNLPFSKNEEKKLLHRFREALETLDMGLEKQLHTPAMNLSGGQRQALALVMLTLSKPKLLLLDEHTAALDPKTSIKIMDITTSFAKTHALTTLMITHELGQALEYGDRLILLKEGKITLDVSGHEKKALQKKDLLELYYDAV